MAHTDSNELNSLIHSSVCTYQAGDKGALDEIYDHLHRFCLRIISKTCGKYVRMEDDQAVIIPHVILDVLDKYDPERGSFMAYLGRAMRNRTIDEGRKAKRNQSVPFSSLDPEQTHYLEQADTEFAENLVDNIARRQEIENLARFLSGFKIDFQQLVQVCPRQKKTRLEAQQVAAIIAHDQELCQYLLDHKMLPNKVLEERYMINRQIMDRYRKYIIATVMIMINDFDYLKSYASPNHS
ncbi:MAG: hypothetical protein ABRQ23_11680 [Syntrophomonadaceae bacterium]